MAKDNNYRSNSYEKNYNNKGKGDFGKQSKQQGIGEFYNPYGFVPLSTNVFTMIDEEKRMLQYCHDIPFRESMSGCLDVTFKAITPFCVGSRKENEICDCFEKKEVNGQVIKVKKKVSKEVLKCPKIGDRFYVPGSSIKGMIENVFRIITFGKIGEYADDNRYSVRELKADSSDYDLIRDSPKSGFLTRINNDYYVIPCNNQKMTYKEIAEKAGLSMSVIESTLKKAGKSLKDKYNSIGKRDFTENNNYYMWFFSGFMSGNPKKGIPGKLHEHLFELTDSQFSPQRLIPVSDKTWDDFIFIHQIENENKSWEYWKKQLKKYNTFDQLHADGIKGLVPVFFRQEGNEVKDFGFSRLYRQPYRKSIHECLPENHRKDGKIDLAQAVFGYSNNEDSLKGRVRFSHAMCENAKELERVYVTSGSPKASFYPFYLKQKPEEVITYGSDSARIRGWKRYLLHAEAEPSEEFSSPDLQSAFRPLQKDTTFTCKIHYHNLRPFELGALIHAIGLLDEEDCYHSLGYAKPFGYGKIAIAKFDMDEEQEDTLKVFENELEKRVGIGFVDDENMYNTILSRLVFLTSNDYVKQKTIRYPSMQEKEFKIIKDDRKNIDDFNPNIKKPLN